MFIFILQLRHMLGGFPELYLFAFYSILIWGLWLTKVLLSQRYRPYTESFDPSTSVVIPVVDEPLDLFRDVLGRIVEQRPDEVIVVINGARNIGLEEVCAEFAPAVRWVHTSIAGKRNAVKVGVELSRGDITVLVDSDTVWTDDTLSELLKPFVDERVGGVTTRQRILEPERSWLTRWADWLENTRSLYSMPAQSALGQVGCLPGRTIAFRRSILISVMDKFMTERFMGVFLEISDDRTLTNLTLKAGFRTVYQHTSLVFTDAPTQVKKLFKQQLRWARGSQYNTLRMLPWMLGHAPLLAVFMLMDIVLPFLLAGVLLGWAYRASIGAGQNFYAAIVEGLGMGRGIIWIVALVIVSSILSMAIRQLRHLSERPGDFLRLPVFIIVSTAFLMPIRLLGFFRMGHVSGWGTRAGAYTVTTTPRPVERGAEHVDDESTRMLAELGLLESAALAERSSGRANVGGLDTRTRQSAAPHVRRRSTAPAPATAVTAPPMATASDRRRLNPQAAWPYVIGFSILALEVVFVVSFA